MADRAEVVAILVAAGRGERMGTEPPKQFLPLGGVPLLTHGLAALSSAPSVETIILVVPQEDPAPARALAASFPRVRRIVPGGMTRRASVAAGLAVVGEGTDYVLVHDAARPLAGPRLAEAVLAAARRWGAAIPGVPVRDTVKQVAGGEVVRTVPRESLATIQTPQAFRTDWLRRAHEEVPATAAAPDDAALLEVLGLPVAMVEGQRDNLKVTDPEDLALAEILLARRGRGPS